MIYLDERRRFNKLKTGLTLDWKKECVREDEEVSVCKHVCVCVRERDVNVLRGRTGSIFYHCGVLSSLMDPTWAERSTTFRHIAQAKEEGRTERTRGSRRGRRSNTWKRERERREEEKNLYKNNHSLKHANILFCHRAFIAFSITSGPECICRSWEIDLIRMVGN